MVEPKYIESTTKTWYIEFNNLLDEYTGYDNLLDPRCLGQLTTELMYTKFNNFHDLWFFELSS
jgi:hypothetical protein